MPKITQRPNAVYFCGLLQTHLGRQRQRVRIWAGAQLSTAFSISPRHLPGPVLGREPDTFLRPPRLPETADWSLRKGLSKAEIS